MTEHSGRPRISATVITFNEERDIKECLESLTWCDEIVLVDSGSTDRTLDIAHQYGAQVVVTPFRGFSEQKNLAASHATGEWILSIDADETVSPELRDEICAMLPTASENTGFFIPRLNLWLSKPIRHSGWYPDHTLRLYKKDSGRWDGLSHEQVLVDGKTSVLKAPIVHKTIASMHDHLRKGLLSSVLELKETKRRQLRMCWLPPVAVVRQCIKDFWLGPKSPLGLRLIYKRHVKNKVDFIWLLPLYPMLRFLYMYIVRLGFLDGAAGFWLAYTSAVVEAMKYLKIWEYYVFQNRQPTSEQEMLENPANLYRSIS